MMIIQKFAGISIVYNHLKIKGLENVSAILNNSYRPIKV